MKKYTAPITEQILIVNDAIMSSGESEKPDTLGSLDMGDEMIVTW